MAKHLKVKEEWRRDDVSSDESFIHFFLFGTQSINDIELSCLEQYLYVDIFYKTFLGMTKNRI